MKEKKIVFRCDGGGNIGWGHIFRCLHIATWLRAKYKIYFVISQSEEVCEFIKKKGYTVFEIGHKDTADKALNTVLAFEPDLVINDIRGTTLEYMQAFKPKGIKTLNFDDTAVSSKMATILVDANRKERKEKEGKYFGASYIVLDSILAKMRKKNRLVHKKVKKILISFGGSDANDLTTKVLESLDKKMPDHIELEVIVGPSFKKNKKDLMQLWKHMNVVFVDKVERLADHLLAADIAVVNGGITMFEAACLGTPTLVIGQNKAEAKNARRLERKNVVMFLGDGAKISKKKIIRKVNHLINSFSAREKLSKKARGVIDGNGIFRVLEKIEMILLLNSLK